MNGRSGAMAVVVLALAACTAEEPLPGPDVIARIATEDIRHADFAGYLERNLGEEGEALSSEALSELLDQFLSERLLIRLARERGFVGAGAGSARATDALLAVEPGAPVTEAQVAAYYAAHAVELARPERVEMAQLLLPDRATAERARRELLAGADFADVAHRLSIDPAAALGGQRGIFTREDLPPAFAAIVFELPEGGISDVVAADYGFHIFRVERRLAAEQPTLDQARPEIVARLEAERADAALARLVAEATNRYAVQVFDRNLPFAYHGSFPVARPYEKR